MKVYWVVGSCSLAAISQTTTHMHGHHEATMGLAVVWGELGSRAQSSSSEPHRFGGVRRGTARELGHKLGLACNHRKPFGFSLTVNEVGSADVWHKRLDDDDPESEGCRRRRVYTPHTLSRLALHSTLTFLFSLQHVSAQTLGPETTRQDSRAPPSAQGLF